MCWSSFFCFCLFLFPKNIFHRWVNAQHMLHCSDKNRQRDNSLCTYSNTVYFIWVIWHAVHVCVLTQSEHCSVLFLPLLLLFFCFGTSSTAISVYFDTCSSSTNVFVLTLRQSTDYWLTVSMRIYKLHAVVWCWDEPCIMYTNETADGQQR